MSDYARPISLTSPVGPSPDATRRAIREHLAAMPVRVDQNGRTITTVEEPTDQPTPTAVGAPTQPAPTSPQVDPSQGQQGTATPPEATTPMGRIRAQLAKTQQETR